MSRWFRMYDEALDDPKVQCLPAEDFRGWFNLLCLASRNDGKIPPVSDVAFALRRSLDDAQTLLQRLRDGGLIDSLSGGPNGCHDAPHAWAKRQYKSDTSTERVKRFRQRSATATETPPDTDTEAETEITILKDSKRALPRCPDDVRSEVWKDYKRQRTKPLTETALAGLRREAGKAGIPLNDALVICCERGWQGFNADWDWRKGNGRQQFNGSSRTGHGTTLDAADDWVNGR